MCSAPIAGPAGPGSAAACSWCGMRSWRTSVSACGCVELECSAIRYRDAAPSFRKWRGVSRFWNRARSEGICRLTKRRGAPRDGATAPAGAAAASLITPRLACRVQGLVAGRARPVTRAVYGSGPRAGVGGRRPRASLNGVLGGASLSTTVPGVCMDLRHVAREPRVPAPHRNRPAHRALLARLESGMGVIAPWRVPPAMRHMHCFRRDRPVDSPRLPACRWRLTVAAGSEPP